MALQGLKILIKGVVMEHLKEVLKASINELEDLIKAKTVVGDPIEAGEYTIIPLISVGFGFGAGGGSDAKEKPEQGKLGAGAGGGGGIRPVAVIVIGPEGVKVEPIKSTSSSFEMIGEIIAKGLQQYAQKREKAEPEEAS